MTTPTRNLSAPRVAILGATGLVGAEMLRLLEERDFPVGELRLLASRRPGSRTLEFRGQPHTVASATPEAFEGLDIVLSSAGGDVSRELLPHAVARGALCIDNTSAFRMQDDVPLVVPEVNAHRIPRLSELERGAIVANPNCSTIQLVVALKPLLDAAGLRKVVVSTYQSISGAGRRAVEDFKGATGALLNGTTELPEHLLPSVAFDVLPEIGEFDADGVTSEETKMILETPKILESAVPVDVTCVRVPVFTGHAESVFVETERELAPEEAARVLGAAMGIVVGARSGRGFATPRAIAGTNPVHVGRLRRSRTTPNGLLFWVVADNLLKGAALNAIQIAEVAIGHPAELAAAGGSA